MTGLSERAAVARARRIGVGTKTLILGSQYEAWIYSPNDVAAVVRSIGADVEAERLTDRVCAVCGLTITGRWLCAEHELARKQLHARKIGASARVTHKAQLQRDGWNLNDDVIAAAHKAGIRDTINSATVRHHATKTRNHARVIGGIACYTDDAVTAIVTSMGGVTGRGAFHQDAEPHAKWMLRRHRDRRPLGRIHGRRGTAHGRRAKVVAAKRGKTVGRPPGSLKLSRAEEQMLIAHARAHPNLSNGQLAAWVNREIVGGAGEPVSAEWVRRSRNRAAGAK